MKNDPPTLMPHVMIPIALVVGGIVPHLVLGRLKKLVETDEDKPSWTVILALRHMAFLSLTILRLHERHKKDGIDIQYPMMSTILAKEL